MLACRLVDQVDRLVGQETLGQVAVAQPRRRDQRFVADRHLVVRLVLRADATQDFDRFVGRRFVEEHRREATLERRVLFDVLAVLVERRRADDTQLATRQCRLHHRAGVDRAFRSASSHDLVQLVDEDDHLALGAPDLVHH